MRHRRRARASRAAPCRIGRSAACGRRARAVRACARARGDAGEGSPCGPRLGGAAAASGGGAGAADAGAGRCRRPAPARSPASGATAQRTIRNSATIGIFRMTISQMKVHVVTRGRSYTRRRIRTSPGCAIRANPLREAARVATALAARSAPQLQRRAAELGDRAQLLDARDDLRRRSGARCARSRTPRR